MASGCCSWWSTACVAAGQSSGRGGAMWCARKKARGEKLGRRPARGRRVGAARTGGGTSRAAAMASGGGLRRQRGSSVGRCGALREGQQEEGEAVGELGGNAWRPGEAGRGLGRHGTAASGDATTRRRRSRGRRRRGGGVKASRPLIRVLVINENSLWINNSL
jgi:hypothetical protein